MDIEEIKTAAPAPAGYEPLARVLQLALEQAAYGKGKVRHADGKAFLEQPIFSVADAAGIGFLIGQAMKKLGEARGMLDRGEISAAKAEFLGAIVYTAATYIQAEKSEGVLQKPADPV